MALSPSAASAQEIIQYDQVAVGNDAAAVCGFCATEKFGAIFYELNGSGLRPGSFPLRIEDIQVAVAGTRVVGDLISGFTCQGDATGGAVDADLEIYAGAAVPSNITQLPAGQWPGETVIVGQNRVTLQKSVDSSPPNNQWNLQINTLTVGQTVLTGNTYIRVVISIPRGGSSTSCAAIGEQPPAFSPFRDDNGRVGQRRGFIYQLGLQIPDLGINEPPQWTWLEDVQDVFNGGTTGINGDWLLRMRVTPLSSVPTDAGVTNDATVDAGPVDSGPLEDGGIDADAGTVGPDAAAIDTDASIVVGNDPPLIAGVTPDEGVTSVPTTIIITGTNFEAGLQVRIGAILAEVTAVNGTSTIDAIVPPGIAPGRYDVLVRNPDGQSAVLSDGFTVLGPNGEAPTESSCRCVRAPKAPWSALGWLVILGLGGLGRMGGRLSSSRRSHRPR